MGMPGPLQVQVSPQAALLPSSSQTHGRGFKHHISVFVQDRPCNFTTCWWRMIP